MNQNLLFDLRYLFSRLWFWALAIGIVLIFIATGNIDALQKIAGSLEAVTLIAATFIAFSVLRSQRLENLDKKLTVEFYYNQKIVLRCANAYLAGESDIRQWGQSIGQLMNGGQRLDFEPFIKESSELVEQGGKQYRSYLVKFTLHSLDGLADNIKASYAAASYPNWLCDFEGNGKTETVGHHEPPSVLAASETEKSEKLELRALELEKLKN